MIMLFNRSVSYLFITALCCALLSLLSVIIQFTWLVLSVFIFSLFTIFFSYRREYFDESNETVSTVPQPDVEQDELESKVQERTLELNIALQELEEANKELQEKNTLDELTGLYNRRHYDQKILAEYRRSRRNLTPLSLVVIDIDHFKRVNDNYGHLAGDACLVVIANCIKQCLRRSTDIGCRYGGEEFCLILPETDNKGALALAEELRESIEAYRANYNGIDISLTISCGLSTYLQQKHIQPEQLFAVADQALYQAKNNGRNQVQQQEITDINAD